MAKSNINLYEIMKIYSAHSIAGANAVKLSYDSLKEKLTVHIKCNDDCAPYWAWGGKYDCTLHEWAKILYYTQKGVYGEKGYKIPFVFKWNWSVFEEKVKTPSSEINEVGGKMNLGLSKTEINTLESEIIKSNLDDWVKEMLLTKLFEQKGVILPKIGGK